MDRNRFFVNHFQNQMLKRVQYDNNWLLSVFVIPNQVLNFALKQVQGLSNSGSIDFGISVLNLNHLGFKALPCRRGSLLLIN